MKAGRLHFPRISFLVPILGQVDPEAQANLIF